MQVLIAEHRESAASEEGLRLLGRDAAKSLDDELVTVFAGDGRLGRGRLA